MLKYLPTYKRVEVLFILTCLGGFGGTIAETLISGHPWTGLLWGTMVGAGFAWSIPSYLLGASADVQ